MIDTRHFAEHGYVRASQLIPADLVDAMAESLWAELRRTHGISRTDRSTWTTVEPRGLGALRKRRAFDALATPAFTRAITQLLGYDRWPAPAAWGDPLVTFPQAGQWAVPTGGWHIDFPARSTLLLKWLAYLAPVTAGGGGTVVLDGSHRLVAQFLRQADPAETGRSSVVRDAVLGARPWMDDVVELTGEPGDVVFMHPHLFHAPAPNHATEPRLMLTGGLVGT